MTDNVNQDVSGMSEEDILSKLVVSEEDVLKKLNELVDKAKVVFNIEKPTGVVLFQSNENLTILQKITALLVGKYFATRLHFIEDYSMTVTEISTELDLPRTSLSGPLKTLLNKKYTVQLENKKYKINYIKIEQVINDWTIKK